MGLRTDFGADVEGAGPLGAHAEGLGAVVKVELDGVAAVDAGIGAVGTGVGEVGAVGLRLVHPAEQQRQRCGRKWRRC